MPGTDSALGTSGSRLQLAEITKTLRDPLFHGYNRLLLTLGSDLRRLTRWLEGCPCHPTSFSMAGQKSKKHIAKLFPKLHRCPASGCRATEIATGALEEGIAELMQTCAATLVHNLENASEEAKRIIQSDLEAAKSYLELGLRLKFNCFAQLPWVLCGLAHREDRKRRACARECLRLYQATEVQGFQEEHHRALTVQFMQGEGGAAWKVITCPHDLLSLPELKGMFRDVNRDVVGFLVRVKQMLSLSYFGNNGLDLPPLSSASPKPAL